MDVSNQPFLTVREAVRLSRLFPFGRDGDGCLGVDGDLIK